MTGLAPFTGERAAAAVVGDDRRRTYRLNSVQLAINYGENVECQLRRELVLLCPQTVAVLYGAAAVPQPRYEAGTRPVLEQVVAAATAGRGSETEQALALMRFCRDLYRRNPIELQGPQYVFGGTEEQLIAKGEQTCECLARLHVALCEIAGIPARIVMHVLGGHICSEVFVDGAWAYMDPRTGVYFQKPDGRLASVWALWWDPPDVSGE